MSIRSKTRVRLVVLISAVVLVGGSGGGGYYLWRRHKDVVALAEREPGMDAAKAGDYPTALRRLGNYLGRFMDKPEERGTARYAEALYNYALAQQMIEEDGKKNLVKAVALWKRYLDLQPNGPQALEARHKLIEAEWGVGWGPEALDSAAAVLKTAPQDRRALEVKVAVLFAQRKLPQAMEAAQAWAAADPHDLAAHQWVERILAVQDPDHAADKTLQYAEGLLAGNPKDPSFQLLVSSALTEGLDPHDMKATGEKVARAAKLAQDAAAADLKDATLVGAVVQQLDRLWVLSLATKQEKQLAMAGQGLELARKYREAHPDSLEYQRIYAIRLLETGDSRKVLDQLAKVTAGDAQADGRLLAIKAMAEFSVGSEAARKDGAALLDAATNVRGKDPGLAALCDAIRATWVTPAGAKNLDELRKASAARLESLKVAQGRAANDLVVNYLLGQANVVCGNLEDARNAAPKQKYYEDARTAFAAAAALGPAWWQARAGLAQTSLLCQQGQAAVDNADLASEMAPESAEMMAFDTLVHAVVTAPGQTAQIDQVVTMVEELQRRFFDQVTSLNRQQIAAQLQRIGRTEEAIRFLTPATTEPASRPAMETLELARLYRDAKRTKEAQDLCDRLLAEKPTGDVILFAANLAASLGQKDKAEAILGRIDALKPAPGTREAVWAQYYEQYGTPQQAVASWKEVLKTAPGNAGAWRRLLGFCLKTGTSEKFDGIGNFLSLLKEARTAAPADSAIAYLGGLQDSPGRKTDTGAPSVLDELCQGQDSYVRPLIAALLQVRGSDDAAIETTTKALIQCVDALAGTQKTLDTMTEADPAAGRKAMEALLPELQQVADDNSGVMEIQNFLVGWYGLSQRYDQCVAMAIRTIQAFPAHPELTAAVAIPMLARLGRWDEVISVAKEWRQRAPGAPEAADRTLAEAYLNQRKYSQALAQLNDPYLREIAQNKKTPNDYFQVYALYLRILLASDQSDQAVKAVMPLLSDRRWRMAWLGMADALSDERMEAQCLGAVTPAIPAEAGDERGLLALAWDHLWIRTKNATYRTTAINIFDVVLHDAKTAAYAKDLLKRMTSAPQDNGDAIVLWAHWQFAKTSLDASMKAMEPLLQSDAGRVAWITVGYDIPDVNAAAQWYDRAADALHGIPDSPAATYQRFRLAWAWKDLGSQVNQWKGQAVPAQQTAAWRKNAVTMLESLAAQNPTNPTIARVLASAYEDDSNAPAAADTYRKVIKLRPTDVECLNNLAAVLVKLKDKAAAAEAVDAAASAVKLSSDPRLYDTQASVLAVLKGDYAGALDAIQKAIAGQPNNPDWRAARAWILALSGQRDQATRECNQLKQDPNYGKLSDDVRQRLKDVGLL